MFNFRASENTISLLIFIALPKGRALHYIFFLVPQKKDAVAIANAQP